MKPNPAVSGRVRQDHPIRAFQLTWPGVMLVATSHAKGDLMGEQDHLGYVYSSEFVSDDQAAAELSRCFHGVEDLQQLRFKSGRHSKAWLNNVIAVGNSYAFVEPLESSALHMITVSIEALLATLPPSWSVPDAQEVYNDYLARKWDSLRWFLALHYKFNKRRQTSFWKEAREHTDISGWQALLNVFTEGAPLARRNDALKEIILDATPTPFGIGGVDTVLLGQQVPCKLLPTRESPEIWRERKLAAEALVKCALPQREALEAVSQNPEMISELFHDLDSWAGPRAIAFADMSVGINLPNQTPATDTLNGVPSDCARSRRVHSG